MPVGRHHFRPSPLLQRSRGTRCAHFRDEAIRGALFICPCKTTRHVLHFRAGSRRRRPRGTLSLTPAPPAMTFRHDFIFDAAAPMLRWPVAAISSHYSPSDARDAIGAPPRRFFITTIFATRCAAPRRRLMHEYQVAPSRHFAIHTRSYKLSPLP